MGKIDHIEAISNELAAANTVSAIPRRCNHVRNHNSRCKRCIYACKHDAITRRVGYLEVSTEKCTGCGACITACPATAFTTQNVDQNDIVLKSKEIAKRCGGVVCFICEKNAIEVNIDTNNVIVLPCLDYLDEYLLCGLFACGITHIALFQPSCKDCLIDSDDPYINKTIESAKTLLKEWNVEGKIKVFHEIPENMREKNHHKNSIETDNRRSAFAHAGASILNYVTDSIDNMLATDEEKKKLANKSKHVVVPIDDVDPANTYRSVRMITLLRHIGTLPKDTTIYSRFWSDIHIDEARCKYCGACATFCPTRALEYKLKDPSDVCSPATLTFKPELCTSCNLCKDSCRHRALLTSNRVPANYLKPGLSLTLYKDKEPENKNPFGF